MGPWIVMCHVEGGVTGTRQAPLKGIDGCIRYFTTEDEAKAEARRLMLNWSPRSAATCNYWPELADENAAPRGRS